MNENHVLQDDLQILIDAILSSPKNAVIAHLDLNSLKKRLMTLGFLCKIFL